MKKNPYMIKSYIENKWTEPGSLCQAIGIFKEENIRKTISVVGAGGKTTVIRKILKECKEQKIPCAVSTTTHIQAYDVEYFLGEPSVEMFRKLVLQYESVWMGEKTAERKLSAFPDTFIKTISKEPGVLLLEADGAKHLPVKAPAAHEPVIVPETDIVLNVYGMSAVGKKIGEVCFRTEKVTKILGKKEADILCPEDIVSLAKSAIAGRKQVADSMEYHVILNQADTKERLEMAEWIAENIMDRTVERRSTGSISSVPEFQDKIEGVHITAGFLPSKELW